MDENDEVLISGFGRRGKAKGDIPGVRFKIVKVSGVGLLALWKEKKVRIHRLSNHNHFLILYNRRSLGHKCISWCNRYDHVALALYAMFTCCMQLSLYFFLLDKKHTKAAPN